ncbi:MAG: rod-binding protein [Treponema sp.]|nr:rod-binding protein [Treponema sp.]
MNVGLYTNTYSGITTGDAAFSIAKENAQTSKFDEMVKLLKSQDDGKGTVASSQLNVDGRLNGEYTQGYAGYFTSENDKTAKAQGAAVNQANPHVQTKTIDKTSTLYEKALELEGFFVKQMLSSMRNTVMKTKEDDFGKKMYEDMLYDQYAENMTKTAGFGLADQIYLSLV